MGILEILSGAFCDNRNYRAWEIRNSSANKGIFCVLWNKKFHYGVQNSQALLSILSQVYAVYSFQFYFFEIYFILPRICRIYVFKTAFFLPVSPPKFVLHFCSVSYLPHTPTISFYVIWSSSSATLSSSSVAAAAAKEPQYKPVWGLFCPALVPPSHLLLTYVHFPSRSLFIH